MRLGAERNLRSEQEHLALAHLRLDSGPAALREQIAVWGEDGLDPAALDLMRRLKREYDPTRTLSPGRFVGRL